MTESRHGRFEKLPDDSRGVVPGKRAFLVSDLVAGIALAGLILALAATMLKTDLQIRRTREARFRMLLRFENAMARAESTETARLTEAAMKSILKELAPGEPASIDVAVTDLPGKPAGKRVVLKSNVSATQAGSVFLMRDFFVREGRP